MATFSPRLTKEGIYQSKYWYSENPFHLSGYGLPNCTAYAWGRIYELMGSKPAHLSLGDAGGWFEHNQTEGGYEYGYTPKLGAVACWSKSGASGHVAVVEQINADGSYIISQSGYYRPVAEYPPDTEDYFWTNTCLATTNKAPWMGEYTFQGFIYCFNFVGPVNPTGWISKNAYLSQSEREHNAELVWQFFGSRGWTIEAVSALLGNMESESTINPGIWESLIEGAGGYGLTQWTPHTKYSEWAGSGWQNNGNKECERIEWEKDNGEQWFANPDVTPSNPPITFKEFSTSKLPIATLANYFMWYYEHPKDPIQPIRAEQAEKWYNFLKALDPYPPNPPASVLIRKSKTSYNKWMYLISHINRRL